MVNMNLSIHNKFDIEVKDSRTGEVVQRAKAENVVCDYIWTCISKQWQFFCYMQYGNGTGTPSSKDTSLFSLLGYVYFKDFVFENDIINNVASATSEVTLPVDANNNQSITELGIGVSYTNGSIISHAMIKNSDGSLSPIQKDENMIVSIKATIYLRANQNGYDSGNIRMFINSNNQIGKLLLGRKVNGLNTYDYIGFRYQGYINSDGYRMSTAKWPDATTDLKLAKTTTLSATNKTIVLISYPLTAASANAPRGIPCISLCEKPSNFNTSHYPSIMASAKVGGSWYPYSDIRGEILGTGDGTTTKFKTKYDFPYDATVYVNGQEITSAKVTKTRCSNNLTVYSDLMELIGTTGAYYNSTQYIPPTLIADFTNRYTGSAYLYSGGSNLYYNTAYEYGITSMLYEGYPYSLDSWKYVKVECSNDLHSWITIDNPISIPVAYQKYKYWKLTTTSAGNGATFRPYVVVSSDYPEYNVEFESAPPDGLEVTIDYKAAVIDKTNENTLTATFTISLN